MTNVTMVISRFSPSIGGTERQALLLSKQLIRRGWPVDVLTQRYAAGLAAEEVIDGVPVHRLPPTGTSALASGLFLLNGLRYLRRQRPGILHAHMLATPAVLACWAARRTPPSPVLVKLSCSGSYGEISVGRASWLGRYKTSTVLSAADRLVCVTGEVADELRAEGIKEDRLARIPNGVDTQEFAPAESPAMKRGLRKNLQMTDGVWILFAGRLTRQKRPDLVLSAFLRSAAQRADLFLMMVGEGEDQSALVERAQSAGMAARIRWAGRQSDMAPFYRASDLFVLPSEAEGMSNSLLEAMSSELACVVSRSAMAQEMVGENEGVVVGSGDSEGLSRAFNCLANDPARRASLGAAARRRVQARYGIERITDQYISLYTDLISSAREAA